MEERKSRISRDEWAVQLAVATSQRSTCMRRAVGCVLLNKRGHLLSTGVNGVASGLPHCNEIVVQPVDVSTLDDKSPEFWNRDTYPHQCPGAQSPSGTNLDGCEAIHAEQNALLQCKDVYEIETCYVTTSPCMTCTKLLLNTTCKRIVFTSEYPHTEARALWEKAGRIWQKFTS